MLKTDSHLLVTQITTAQSCGKTIADLLGGYLFQIASSKDAINDGCEGCSILG